jgi:nucleolar GTP-binding protein
LGKGKKMNLYKLPGDRELLEIALRRGRKRSGGIGRQASRLKREKVRETTRVEASASYIIGRLEKAVREFPSIEKGGFYRELIQAIVDPNELKRALAQLNAVASIARKLKREHTIRIKKLGRGEESKAKDTSRRFFGRLASLLKSLHKSIAVYNLAVEKLRELPVVRENCPTIIIAGFPNVGKSTLLRRLTGSNVKTAPYPFTTQRLEMGCFSHRYQQFQVIDTPGLLDRPPEKRNPVERKGVAALRHAASLIIFVVDPTERCGFTLKEQLGLLKSVKKEFKRKLVVFLSKRDIASAKQIGAAERLTGKLKTVKGNPGEIRAALAKELA